MHRMRKPVVGLNRALLDDTSHGVVLRHLPRHTNRLRHAAQAVWASGLAARRVHSTKPSGAGSPEATPSVNGLTLARATWRPIANVAARAPDETSNWRLFMSSPHCR